MIQEILTYLIITFTAGYSVYSFIRFLLPNKNKKKSTCSGNCGSCSVKNKMTAELKISEYIN